MLMEAGRIEDAIAWFRRAGDSHRAAEAVELLKDTERENKALRWLEIYATRYRSTQETITDLAPWMERSGSLTRAIERFQARAEAGEEFNAWVTARLFQQAGQVEEALRWYQRAAEEEDRTALPSAVWMLRTLGRTEDGSRLHRYGWEPGGSIARPWAILPEPSAPPRTDSG
jgi:tetratricopeptide (TPR) repeat protein